MQLYKDIVNKLSDNNSTISAYWWINQIGCIEEGILSGSEVELTKMFLYANDNLLCVANNSNICFL